MQLTPQQQQELLAARAVRQRRVSLKFTPEQAEEWRTAAEHEQANKQENIVHFRKIQAAMQQPGFHGDIRRAITASRCPLRLLAEQTGIDAQLLSDFRAGDADLPAPALDRLLEFLGLRLMQEIPR